MFFGGNNSIILTFKNSFVSTDCIKKINYNDTSAGLLNIKSAVQLQFLIFMTIIQKQKFILCWILAHGFFEKVTLKMET